jgi:anti-sigma regulatory factor (Ser/Thr protein kinase)
MRTVTFTIPSDFSHVALVTRCVIALAGHVTGTQSGVFETAVGEALNNVIEHSYGADTDEEISVELSFDADSLRIIIEDGGTGMDPTLLQDAPAEFASPPAHEALPEGGFGLTIIKQACDEVTYEQDDGLNRLTMIRRRRPEDASASDGGILRSVSP